MTGHVLTVGEAMASLRSHGRLRLGDDLTLSVAGAEANVAIGLARLGHRTGWLGRLGDDELGELVLRTLRAEQVDVAMVERDAERATGLMLREQRTSGAVDVQYLRRGSAGSALDPSLVSAALASGPRLVHVSGVTSALSESAGDAVAQLLGEARAAGVTTSLDVNYRSRLWTREQAAVALRPLLDDVDVLFASGDEVDLVLDDVPGSLAELVLTHGASGAEAWHAGGHGVVDAARVRAVDVVGAGDAFVAGYLSARLDGLDVPARLERGAAVAGVAVATYGDWEGLPTRSELRRLRAADVNR